MGGGWEEEETRQVGLRLQDSPVVHGLGEPAEDGVPVGQVGLLLGHVLLTVAEHLGQQAHEAVRLLLQHPGAEGAQVQEVACKERRQSATGWGRHASLPPGPAPCPGPRHPCPRAGIKPTKRDLWRWGCSTGQGSETGQSSSVAGELADPQPTSRVCFLLCKTRRRIPYLDMRII